MITEAELLYMYNTMQNFDKNVINPVWKKAFEFYNSKNDIQMSITVRSCYLTVYNYCRATITNNVNDIYATTTETMEETENDLMNDIQNSKPSKFKLNPIGIFFVSGTVCIIWKTVDLIIYVIHLF